MFKEKDFVDGIQSAMNVSLESKNGKYELIRKYRDFETSEEKTQMVGEITLPEIKKIEEDLSNDFSFNELMLWNPTTFEIAVQVQDRLRMPPFRPDRTMYTVSEHNLDFAVSLATSKYIFALLSYSATHPEYVLDFSPVRTYRQEKAASLDEISEGFRIFTVKITSNKSHSVTEFKRMLHAYLFNISFNHNITFSIADFSESRRTNRSAGRRAGQLFPYKAYNQELTTYYHQAVSTNIPFTQYLAYYHVAEFFIQSISEQDAFQEIEEYITRPSFSPYKKEDIKRFYNMIKKKMREQREDGVWNEKTGLLLCLKKYVPDLDALKNDIDTIDSSAINHYKSNLVEFADDSQKIDFSETEEKLYMNIRDRVYSVRNAIVHSKEGDRLRYEPFKHDKQLAKEIPLIRSIAEEIIINSAKPLELNFD